MLSMLSRKLRRDLWQIKGQVVAIALVMAAGIAMFIVTFGVIDSLKLTRDTYYNSHRFADVFVSLKRAPRSVLQRLSDIPGVMNLEGRITFGMTLQMPTLQEPATGTIISLPNHGDPLLNKLYLRMGRYPDVMSVNEVVADDAFVEKHGLHLGDTIEVILNSIKRELTIVGIAMSPEFVYSIAPGAMMPDPLRFGVFWMRERSLEATVGMKGAFNDVLLMTEPSANIEEIKLRLDQTLAIYGSQPSYGRELQLSNFFLSNEIEQLEIMGWVTPFIFLSVAAFLINVVMSRLIQTQREQIGMLKALGYSNWEIGIHFVKMASVVTIGGAVIGVGLGIWLAAGLTNMYAEFFRLPILRYHFSLSILISAVTICFIAVYAGIYVAVKNAIQLPPSEAMRPEPPSSFKSSFLTSYHWIQHLSYLSRIILRQLERRPKRALFSVFGLSMALSILIFSFFIEDSISRLVNIQYQHAQREDVNISFVEPVSTTVLDSINQMEGVMAAEPYRDVPVIIEFQGQSKQTSLTATPANATLKQVLDVNNQPLTIPESGLLISQKLADILGLSSGDTAIVQILEEKRQQLHIKVRSINRQWIGLGAYIQSDYLHKLLDQHPRMTTAAIKIDPYEQDKLFQRLKAIPTIISLNIVEVLKRTFNEIMAENLYKSMITNIIFASFICFGVIYNTARIALSERWRELASLRVLGLTNREVAFLLFGELSILTLVAIPVGIFIGRMLSFGMTESMNTELFRIPFYIENSTYGYGTIILLSSTLISFLLVWRQLNRIDLVSAQKGVE